ncbi:hypothetical protein ACJ73_04309 [Blastomyces percursus]|uniref:Uncharacterized protein n=1 Tax=Blastomyces percursus TaxID=1658174 RepID=A0A1J9QVS1_9EURO|nr:hypothetical protein ACJ73_04309 [Blastomyces percursus]
MSGKSRKVYVNSPAKAQLDRRKTRIKGMQENDKNKTASQDKNRATNPGLETNVHALRAGSKRVTEGPDWKRRIGKKGHEQAVKEKEKKDRMRRGKGKEEGEKENEGGEVGEGVKEREEK